MSKFIYFEMRFCAAHFYSQPNWSDEKNKSVFGRCYSDHGHGHNYVVETEFQASKLESENSDLKRVIFAIIDELDHKHLNFDIPEFSRSIPTTENIAIYLREKILKTRYAPSFQRLKIFETDHIWVEIQ